MSRFISKHENAIRMVAGEHGQGGGCAGPQAAVRDVDQGHRETLVQLGDLVLGHVYGEVP